MKLGNESITVTFTEVHKIPVAFFMSHKVYQWPQLTTVFCATMASRSQTCGSLLCQILPETLCFENFGVDDLELDRRIWDRS